MTGEFPSLALGESKRLLARAAQVDATLAYSGYVLARDRLVDGEYPLYGETRLWGPRLGCRRQHATSDFILAYGTIVLGHADPVVSEAVLREIRDGFAITLRKRVQVELAELLTSVIPNAERVFLLKSGSDATSAAVRISRAHTGRERVIRWGYNGWHDWCANRPAGVPRVRPARRRHASTTTTWPAWRRSSTATPARCACLLMMPFEVEPPAPGFLQRRGRDSPDDTARCSSSTRCAPASG